MCKSTITVSQSVYAKCYYCVASTEQFLVCRVIVKHEVGHQDIGLERQLPCAIAVYTN
jgi:hypothetical protein